MTVRLAVIVWTLALAVAGLAAAVAIAGGRVGEPATDLALPLAAGLAFIGAGLIARTRRPESRTGLLMAAVGFTWFLGALNWSDSSALFTLGAALSTSAFGFFAWLLVAFPSGRLQTRIDRAIVAGAFAVVLLLPPASLLFQEPALNPTCGDCPPNALLLTRNDAVADALMAAFAAGALAIAVAVVARLAMRYRRATPPARRVVAPVYATAGVVLVAGVLTATLPVLIGEWLFFDVIIYVGLLAVPVAFLYGLLRERLARAAVERLVVRLDGRPGPGDVRQAIARALGDPSVALLHYDAGRYVDSAGRPARLDAVGPGRTATVVERDGTPLAAIVHDVSLLENPQLLDSVTATAALVLETEGRYQDLRRTKERSDALLDAIPDLIFRIGMDGVYRGLKYENERDLTAPPDEILGSSLHDLLPREAAGRIMECALRARDGGGAESVEYRLELENGVRDFEGRVVYAGDDEFLLIVRDFTERKRQEAELRRVSAELERRLSELERERDFIRAVVDTAPSMLCLTDPEGRIVRFNRALEVACGWSDGELRGEHFWAVLIPPDAVDETRRSFDELAGGGKPAQREFPLATRDGRRLVVEWIARPVRDEQGALRFLFGGLDVTHRKRQEDELRASRARIVEAGDAARRRLERDLHDGAQQRLVAMSVALRLAKARLRNDPEGAEAILAGAADELTHALEELRELARGIHPAVLSDRGLEPALAALAARSPVPVAVEAPEERLPAAVEAAAYFVVSEALANAAKHARAEAVSVRVASENGTTIVEVADDGAGGADPGRGSGLRGLEDRVAALDGVLRVESRNGRGTTIRAEIPTGAAV